MDLKFQYYNVWLLSFAFFVISMGITLLIPKYNTAAFLKTPRIKFITGLNYLSYYGIFVYSLFIPFHERDWILITGIILYLSGLGLYTISVFSFAVKEFDKPVTDRIYKYSRHPVYVSFIIMSIGIAVVSLSIITAIFVCLYFVSSYFIMKKEEEFCTEKYGELYLSYKKRTRMIFGFSSKSIV